MSILKVVRIGGLRGAEPVRPHGRGEPEALEASQDLLDRPARGRYAKDTSGAGGGW